MLSINIAALVQEFAPLQEKQTSMEDSIEFQNELEEIVDDGVSPAGLQPFLEYVIRAIRLETESFRGPETATDSGQAREELLAFIDDVEAQLSVVENRIRESNSRLSIVLLSMLDYPYAQHINIARHLKTSHKFDLTEAEHRSLERLLKVLTFLASGREYFTTLYFKRELRNLSSNLLLLSLPVIVFTSYVLLAIDTGLFPRSPFPGIQSRLLYVNLAFVISLSPYVLLSSYMLRILAVSKHSLESTVFTLETDDDREIER